MSKSQIINGKQSTFFLFAIASIISTFAYFLGFKTHHILSIFYGTACSSCYYLLLDYQRRKGLKISHCQAARNINEGFLSRLCVIITFVLIGTKFFGIIVPAMLIGVFVPLRFLLVWEVILLTREPFLDRD